MISGWKVVEVHGWMKAYIKSLDLITCPPNEQIAFNKAEIIGCLCLSKWQGVAHQYISETFYVQYTL